MEVETHIYCDKCGKGVVYSKAMSKSAAIWLARERGWTVGKQWLCPDCRRQKEGEE